MSDGFAGLAPCVHCGFCLQSCPTFLETGDEADSPRGRIYLMQGLARGDFAPTDAALSLHLDRCLGCRACEPVCPSGVIYGPALEQARHQIAVARGVPLLARVVLTIMAEPALRGPAMTAARLVRRVAGWLAGKNRIRFAFGMLAATAPWNGNLRKRSHPDTAPPAPAPHPAAPVAVFLGCIQRGLFGHVNAATRRTLAANGYRVVDVAHQQCCGALHAHTGLHRDALRLARANIAAFRAAPDAGIVVNAAGCGAQLKSYPGLFSGDPLEDEAADFARRVLDVSETLAATGPRVGAPLPLTVSYDPPCHLLHAQRIDAPPRAVLAAIPDLRIVNHRDADSCCGGAGIYTLLEPAMSRAVLDRKVTALAEDAPDVVVTGNPGCIMQIGAGLRAAGLPSRAAHPVELLDHSYRAAGFYDRITLDSVSP